MSGERPSDLEERSALLERLCRIQRSISHHAPLQEVLDAITTGAAELLADDAIVGLRLIDPDDPAWMRLVSGAGLTPEWERMLARRPVGEGAGGRCIAEDRLIVVHDYEGSGMAVPLFAEQRLTAAMGAPVPGPDGVTGSLTVGSFTPGRTYSRSEQEALVAFAEHAGLALSDARTVEAMREAQRAERLFMAMVTHDLKGPLTAILGILRTVAARRSAIPEATLFDLLAGAIRRGDELVTMVDRLLHSSRAQLTSPRERVLLPTLIDEVVDGFDQIRPLRVGDIPRIAVLTDAGGARVVLETLLENAVRHGVGDRPIEVDTELDTSGLSILVRNAGHLAPETQEQLFVPFKQGTSKRAGGVGLGLYIASRVAEAMDGTIGCASHEGVVTFALRLPPTAVERVELAGGSVARGR